MIQTLAYCDATLVAIEVSVNFLVALNMLEAWME